MAEYRKTAMVSTTNDEKDHMVSFFYHRDVPTVRIDDEHMYPIAQTPLSAAEKQGLKTVIEKLIVFALEDQGYVSS